MSEHETFQPRRGLWRRIGRWLATFGDGLDATEASVLEKRVVRLERDVADLKTKGRA